MLVLLTVYRAFLSIFRAWFYIRISVVNIFCLSSLLFYGHVPEIKIDWLIIVSIIIIRLLCTTGLLVGGAIEMTCVTVLYYSSKWFKGGTRNRRLGDDWNRVEPQQGPEVRWQIPPTQNIFAYPPVHLTHQCVKSQLADYTYKCRWAFVSLCLLHFLLSHTAVHHLHHLHYHRLHLLLLVQYFILNSRFGFSPNSFLHRPFPFLPDWFHRLSDHLMILLCSTAGFVCMVC